MKIRINKHIEFPNRMADKIHLDDITYKRLILVKQIFARGEQQLSFARNYPDKIMGLISLDLATETVLKAIVANEPPKTREPNFHELVQNVKEFLIKNGLKVLNDEANINKVRKLRNFAQHEAESPNESALGDCRTYTRDFLFRIVPQVWGIEFGSLSLLDLIAAAHLKDLMIKATDNFAEQKYTDACFDAVAAFDRLIGSTKFAIVGRDSQILRTNFDHAESPQLRSIVGDINLLKTLVLHSMFNIDLAEYNKYRSFTSGIISHWFGGDKYAGTNARGECSEAETAFVIDFVTNVIVNVEAIVGDVEKPFGIDALRWPLS